MNENNANFTPDAPSFKTLVFMNMQKLTNFPYIEADFDALTNYQLLSKVVEYLNEVIANNNEQNEVVEDLYNAYVSLQNYVNNYFDNLDVQEEINNKLDEMARSGELTNLIKDYVDPIIDDYEEEINTTINEQNTEIQSFKSNVNSQINTINTKVDAATSGSPLPATSTAGMTDTSRIYVNTTNGYWYYYDGDSWEQGGVYQSIVDSYDTTLTQDNTAPNSSTIGNMLNPYYLRNNLFNKYNITDNVLVSDTGVENSNSNYVLCNEIIPVKQGDTIYGAYLNSENYYESATIGYLIYVNAFGEFQSRVNVNANYYVIETAGYIKVNFIKASRSNLDNVIIYLNEIEYKDFFKNKTFLTDKETQNNTSSINDITVQHNYFDKDNFIDNCGLTAQYNISHTGNNLFISNLIPCKIGDVFRCHYFGQDSSEYRFVQVVTYNENKIPQSRDSVGSTTYTAAHNGYVKFNVRKKIDETTANIQNNFLISVNEEITSYFPYKKYANFENAEVENPVKIEKVNDNEFLITFGLYNIGLIHLISQSLNADNWTLKTIKKDNNIVVTQSTDIIGPVIINDNPSYIGGNHGNEKTIHISISIGGATYTDSELSSITSLSGDILTITAVSEVYDQLLQDKAFDKYLTISFSNNKIHISNTYKVAKNLTLKTAYNGGLIGCQNGIIDSIKLNNCYFSSPPTTQPANASSIYNTSATINTIYGSITMNNLKGWQLSTYRGRLKTYENENPIRNKIYFELCNGSYQKSIGDIISGEFEYVFS